MRLVAFPNLNLLVSKRKVVMTLPALFLPVEYTRKGSLSRYDWKKAQK